MAVDKSPLDAATLAELTSWLPRLPRAPGGYEGNTFTDLATFPIFVGGVRFFPVCTPFNQDGNQIVKGWQKDMGGGTWYGYDLAGKFTGTWYADNSWQHFIEAATLPAIAYGVEVSGIAAAAGSSVPGDMILPGALGVDGASSYAASEAAAFASSIAPWAAPSAAAVASTVTPVTSATTAASVAAPIIKGVTAVAAGATALTSKPGSVNPVTGQQTPYATPPGATLGGLPIGLILAAGAALLAFS